MIRNLLHEKTLQSSDRICEWYKNRSGTLQVPVYSSYDIRDAGYKISNVDANIYPAGFNNICQVDRENAGEIFERYMKSHYGSSIKKILVVTEEHTSNPFYWENIDAIRTIIQNGGYDVRFAFPRQMDASMTMTSSTGKQVEVGSAYYDSSWYKDFDPQLILSNNDFSISHEAWQTMPNMPVNPPRELGWYQRKKSRYFKFYNQLVREFSDIANVDPFLMTVETDLFEHFDIGEEGNRKELSGRVDDMLNRLRGEYKKRGISQEPFLFVKNNAGTYGLGVIRVSSGQEVLEWTYKSRKKMKAAKGGRDVEEVIIQEGIPSIVESDGPTAEPVIYMIGCELAGGFLRTHQDKDSTESLNSPGAVYKRLCVTDLNVDARGCPYENAYGWTAKLGLLAIGMEAQEMGVTYKGFQNTPCGSTKV